MSDPVATAVDRFIERTAQELLRVQVERDRLLDEVVKLRAEVEFLRAERLDLMSLLDSLQERSE